MQFQNLTKLKEGDKVAIVSPSFAAPGKWPHIYELGCLRLREVFKLEPVSYPATSKVGASAEERSADLIAAFSDPEIKAVISSLGGDDQVTYIKNLPNKPFINNPKPYFGFSDNSHFENFLWLNGVPSFYGGALFTEFAMQGHMDEFTSNYLRYALFEKGKKELMASPVYNDIGLDWGDVSTVNKERTYETNEGWIWDNNNSVDVEGISWGGCIESIDEILRHNIALPTLKDFEEIILFAESSEEIPSAPYVFRVFRALGERGILKRVRAIMIGRPKAWEFDKQFNAFEKTEYRKQQREAIIKAVRNYNKEIPIIQNLDFGHTAPQICLPNGCNVFIKAQEKRIFANF